MIAIGSDHGGYNLKKKVVKFLEDKKLLIRIWGVIALIPVIIQYLDRR